MSYGHDHARPHAFHAHHNGYVLVSVRVRLHVEIYVEIDVSVCLCVPRDAVVCA